MSNFSEFREKLAICLVAARKPLIWFESFDYRFVVEELESVSNEDFRIDSNNVSVWDQAYGSRLFKANNSDGDGSKLDERIKEFIEERNSKLLIAKVQKDTFEKQPELVSLLQNFVYYNNLLSTEKKKTIILISPYFIQLDGLEHSFERLTMPLPDKVDIKEELGFIHVTKKDFNKDYINGSYHFSKTFMRNDTFKKNSEDLVNALLGLHLYDIRSLLQTVQSETNRNVINAFYPGYRDLAERILIAKKQIVQNSGLLEIVDVEDGYEDNVGNIDNLVDYLRERSNYIDNFTKMDGSQEDEIGHSSKTISLPLPKGILLVGEPGCGKSESAKAVSSILKKPLLRLNMGGLLGQYVGQSENNFIEALRTAEAAQPCILWIDEIEKAFAGAGKDTGNNDTVMTRVIGIFLTWMQEHKSLVYLVATANDLSLMKDEFLRKGRWDEIFYLSKPDEKGRIDILKKSLHKYKLQLCGTDKKAIQKDMVWMTLAKLMNDMSGADIASVVISTVQKVYGDPQKEYEYPLLPFHVLKENIEVIKQQKEKAEQERVEINVKRDVLDFKIQNQSRDLSTEKNETILKTFLQKRYSKKKSEEVESEYKAFGYISAANKSK